MGFKWDAFFETGLPLIDEQHRGLVALINEAEPLLSSPESDAPARLDVLFSRLFEYAAVHFRTEEALMTSCGLMPAYRADHAARHRAFVDDLIGLQTQLTPATRAAMRPGLLRFLTSWLTFHILDEDQRMARQIARLKNGESAAQAMAAESDRKPGDPARTALADALLDLYAVVGERNRALQRTNAQLEEATRDLAIANSGLEARVAERTAELQATVNRLAQTQGQLLQSEKMAAIGQLAAGVAHEINNPVGFVSSNLGSLRKYVDQFLEVIAALDALRPLVPVDDPCRQRAERVLTTADLPFLRGDTIDLLDESEQGLGRVKKIVQDLKDFSRVDQAEFQEADLNAGLESTLNVVANELKYKATLVKHYGELPPVHCMASQINQVFMNLLVNAGQSIEGKGVITLSTGATAETVWVEIADTGKGMPPEVQARIFEPFYTTKPVGQGTGLGLSISWDIIVKKHQGRLTVYSQVGEGTTFRIELPRAGRGTED